MIRKACATAILAVSLTGSAWAERNFGPYYVNPTVESELVTYSGSLDGGLADYFSFSFASGSSVKIDFQGYPEVGTDVPSWEFFLYSSSDLGIALESWNGTSSNFRSFTADDLTAGTSAFDDYTVKVYGGQSLPSGSAGSYSLTLSIDQTAPVPEPETYAMMLAGLGLLGIIGRRRKLKSAA